MSQIKLKKSYKFRAECLTDVQKLYNFVDFQDNINGLRIEKDVMGSPDVEVFFRSDLKIDQIRNIMASIPDSHVMQQSLTLAKDYTGIREEVWGTELKNIEINEKEIPQISIIEPKFGPKYIKAFSELMTHQTKFMDNGEEKLKIITKLEQVKKSSTKDEFDRGLSEVNKMIKEYPWPEEE